MQKAYNCYLTECIIMTIREDYHMNRKRNVFIGLITCALLITTVFFVFNQGKSNEQVVKEYFGFLNDRNYKQM